MPPSAKATRIALFSLATPQMPAFHLTWHGSRSGRYAIIMDRG